jgi:hypothetical protein
MSVSRRLAHRIAQAGVPLFFIVLLPNGVVVQPKIGVFESGPKWFAMTIAFAQAAVMRF